MRKQRVPYNAKASTSSRIGWWSLSEPTVVRIHGLPLELMNNKSNNKKNELWKMKLSM